MGQKTHCGIAFDLGSRIQVEVLNALVDSLEMPVSSRESRFGEYVKTLECKTTSAFADKDFVALIDPHEQAKVCLQGISNFLRAGFRKSLPDDDRLKIVVYRFDGQQISSDKVYFYPPSATPTLLVHKLMEDDTAVRRSFISGQLVYIEDIKNPKDNLRFVEPALDEGEGSLLCYPIGSNQLHRRLAVLSIFTTKTGFFNAERVIILNKVLPPYIERLKTELYLILLKERLP